MLIGIILMTLSGFMVVCGLVDLYYGSDEWKTFIISAMITLFVGGALHLTCKSKTEGLSVSQGFIFTSLAWLAVPLFSSLPFYLYPDFFMSFTDSFFEAMSGIASCGATVMIDLNNAPKGILLWRAVLNWLGGIGIIVVAIAILPALKVGGMQLFKMESSDKSDKILPKAQDIATGTVGIYVVMTAVCTALLFVSGMGLFDAICHAMAALATGGFSTKDSSLAWFNNLNAEIIITVFMILSALPYVIFIQAAQGRFKPLFKDAQVRTFLALLAFFILTTAAVIHYQQNRPILEALRHASFNVTSVMTTTGFSSENYALWPAYGVFVLVLVSVIGGCTGSTAGAIKIIRLKILFELIREQIFKLIHPHRVYIIRYNSKPIKDGVVESMLVFFFVYVLSIVFFTGLVSLSGQDFITSISAATSALAAAGYGLGDVISPAGSYKPLTDFAKWSLCAAMYLGRLEFFTVLVLLTRTFWSSARLDAHDAGLAQKCM